MNKDIINIINHYSKNVTQRELSTSTGYSLGKVNKLLTEIKNNNLLDNKVLNQYEVKSAVILAAGFGLRMIPLTDIGPKALLKVNGEVIIERLINQLKEKGINNIHIVVGYQKEKFEYLIDKYNVHLIVNKDYASDNNCHSVSLASKYLSNSYIVPGDLYFVDNPFNKYEYSSYYALSNKVSDFGYFYMNKSKQLAKGVDKFFDAVGLSYLDNETSQKLIRNIKVVEQNNERPYWEESLFLKGNKISVDVRFINHDKYIEINTFEDLRKLEGQDFLQSKNLKLIADVFNVDVDDIKNVTISKKGMTNRSFTFEVKDKKYIMRIPGEGTELLINRLQEYEVYQIVSKLGISDKVIYMDPKTGIKITEFFVGSHNCDFENGEEVSQCMKKLHGFHDMKLSVNFEFDIFGQILYYEKLMGGTSLYSDYEEVKANVFALKPFIDKVHLPYQLCHIDSVPDNFLIRGDEIKLIDWEYASNQDPHVDIAMFAIYCGYDKSQLDKLIDYYFNNNCPELVRYKIYAYVSMAGLLWSNWCEYKYHLGVEFGEYSLSQYRYGKEYSRLVLEYLKSHEY